MEKIDFIANGTVTTPQGFMAGAASADIRKKKDNRLDLGIVSSKEICEVAGLFTDNKIKSPSVILVKNAYWKVKPGRLLPAAAAPTPAPANRVLPAPSK
jgi:N-acetylglutamate synthase/N-acetylornithine aminotransferase